MVVRLSRSTLIIEGIGKLPPERGLGRHDYNVEACYFALPSLYANGPDRDGHPSAGASDVAPETAAVIWSRVHGVGLAEL